MNQQTLNNVASSSSSTGCSSSSSTNKELCCPICLENLEEVNKILTGGRRNLGLSPNFVPSTPETQASNLKKFHDLNSYLSV